MKASILPLFFEHGRDAEFDQQLDNLTRLLAGQADFLPPRALGESTGEADAVVFPQLLGEAYRQADKFTQIAVPILVITSEFGTLSMWDWEICGYLDSLGVKTIGIYNLEQTRNVIRSLAVKRELKNSRFLVYQDNPGEGFQASIFKNGSIGGKTNASSASRASLD